MAHPLTLPTDSKQARLRTFALALVLWAFGLSTTTLLVGVWGRSVASDQTTISSSVSAALDPATVSDQITDWIVSEAISVPSVAAPDVEELAQRAAASPVTQTVIQSLIADFVAAASAPPGSSTVLEVGRYLEPLRPELAATLSAADLDVSEAEIDGVLSQVEGLVISSSEPVLASRPVDRARGALTVVMVVGASAMLALGVLAVYLAEHRLAMLRSLANRLAVSAAMLRSLANRLAVSAATFALFLRISAWAVDPGGGRSPVRAGSAVLLGSNHGVLVVVAILGIVLSLVITRQLRTRRLRSEPEGGSSGPDSRQPPGSPSPPAEAPVLTEAGAPPP